MFNRKFVTVTSCVALGGYLAGLSTNLKTKNNDQDQSAILNSTLPDIRNIKPRPALPIFGTISAATMVVPVKNELTKTVPPEPSDKSPRVTQVI